MRFETPENLYSSKYFSAQHPLLSQIKQSLVDRGLDFMSVSPVEAGMLQFFVKAFRVKSIVEIGSLAGYSTLAMALCLEEDGRIFAFEKDEERASEVESHLGAANLKCQHQVFSGSALERLPDIEKFGPFDLVFIDANKNDYCNYLDWAEKNTMKGSLIIGDNTFLFGALWGKSRDTKVSEKQIKVMDEFNARLGNCELYESILIPTLEGLTVAHRRS